MRKVAPGFPCVRMCAAENRRCIARAGKDALEEVEIGWGQRRFV